MVQVEKRQKNFYYMHDWSLGVAIDHNIGQLQNCRALLIQSQARWDFYLKKHWSAAK
jgi:hypothetical protein